MGRAGGPGRGGRHRGGADGAPGTGQGAGRAGRRRREVARGSEVRSDGGAHIGASRQGHDLRGATRLTGPVAPRAQAVAASPFRQYERRGRHRPVPAAAPARALYRPRQQRGTARGSRERPQLRGDRTRLGPSPAGATRGPTPDENGEVPGPRSGR